jgi:hypothetical protein
VRPFGLGVGAFDNDVIDLPVIVSSLPLVVKIDVGAPVIVRIVPWVGKVLVCCRGSQICCGGGGGGLDFGLVCLLALLDVGYVIWGIGGGYVICGAYEGYVICGADESCRSLVVI